MKFWTEKAFALLTMLSFNSKSVLAFKKKKKKKNTGVVNSRPLQLHNGFIKYVVEITAYHQLPLHGNVCSPSSALSCTSKALLWARFKITGSPANTTDKT